MNTFEARVHPEEFDDLLGRGRPVRYGAGDYLMRQGEQSDCVMVLRHGHVKILSQDASGGERLLAIRRKGELLGEFAFFREGARTASVKAHDDVTVVKVPGTRFLDYLAANPAIQQDLLRLAIAKLCALESKRAEVGPGTAVPRLLRVLVDAADAFADDPTSGRLLVPLTQQQLGEMAGMAVLTAHRAVKTLRERGILGVGAGKRKVLIPCLACLRRAALSTQIYGNSDRDINGCGGVGRCPER
ncbi:CRP-like cAMP-binding protein [Saccharothrix tamanrassetensis]|uniref:CRP-like cAMP-binding protein n=1 Tax=Saccharothrix tamanrassetensis TaxID=1051531 RepID=A0A841CHB0_9PSEU|nr:Crp/Fnr family transcriptional regulator [Saccharothrix tamanrassetensis]MBB5956370.1 CRP-like cAMP-binding protein [Saccharothrix tamanrassetensis]